MDDLARRILGLGRPRIAVVGDLMLDEYIWGEVERISPEAPVPVLRAVRRQVRPGGAGSVVVNLARLGAEVTALGALGRDAAGDRVRDVLLQEGCDLGGVVESSGRPTTRKTRLLGYVQQSDRAVQQLLRVDEEEIGETGPDARQRIVEAVRARRGELDAVLVSDYGKGLVGHELVRGLIEAVPGVPVLADPARIDDYSRYRGVALICPNRFEAELASGTPCHDLDRVEQAAARLVRDHALGACAVTLDREGILLGRADDATHYPTHARTVADVTGAGDMVLSILGVVLAAGGTLEEAVRLANVAAGLEVARVGVAPVTREEIVHELRYEGHPAADKVRSPEELVPVCEAARRDGRRVAFTNGCFDLLHRGHHELLAGARREGDLLIVAVNSDASVRRLKGPARPSIPEEGRVRMLAGLEVVDFVTVFEDDTPNGLLESLRPDVLVKGSEYREGVVVGREIVEGYGGRVAFVEQVPGWSTTGLLSRGGREGVPPGSGGVPVD